MKDEKRRLRFIRAVFNVAAVGWGVVYYLQGTPAWVVLTSTALVVVVMSLAIEFRLRRSRNAPGPRA